MLLCMLGGGVSKHLEMVIADSMTERVFTVFNPDGSISSWYPFARGFGQGYRGGGLQPGCTIFIESRLFLSYVR